MTDLILGFDVLAASELATWVDGNENTRENFFLRPEIQWPLSVDRVTCPSIFQPEFRASAKTKLVLTRFPIDQSARRAITRRVADWPAEEINILGLWNSLDRMLD